MARWRWEWCKSYIWPSLSQSHYNYNLEEEQGIHLHMEETLMQEYWWAKTFWSLIVQVNNMDCLMRRVYNWGSEVTVFSLPSESIAEMPLSKATALRVQQHVAAYCSGYVLTSHVCLCAFSLLGWVNMQRKNFPLCMQYHGNTKINKQKQTTKKKQLVLVVKADKSETAKFSSEDWSDPLGCSMCALIVKPWVRPFLCTWIWPSLQPIRPLAEIIFLSHILKPLQLLYTLFKNDLSWPVFP